jgi:hypothetical protein
VEAAAERSAGPAESKGLDGSIPHLRVPRVRVFGPGIRRTSIDQSSRFIFPREAKAGCPGSVFSDPGYYGPQSANLRDSYSLGRRKPRRAAVHSDSISTTSRVPRVRVFGPGILRTSIDQSSRLIFPREAKASPPRSPLRFNLYDTLPGAPGPCVRTRDTTDLNRPIFETHILSGGESLAATQSTPIQSLRHPAGCPGSVFSDPGYDGPQSTNLRDSYSFGRRKPRRRVPRVRLFGPGILRTSIGQSLRLIFPREAKASPRRSPL